MKAISSRDNPLVKRLHALASSGRERRILGETLLDGAHLVQAALERSCRLKGLVVSESGVRKAEIADLLGEVGQGLPCHVLPDTLFAHVSPVDTPSGVLAIIDLPAEKPLGTIVDNLVVLDGVQDPGNLGTILRTAAAAGVRHVLLAEGCAGAWSPRVLRAGMGAHFVLEVHERVDLAAWLPGFGGQVLATALSGDACSLYDLDLRAPVAWVFGGEGQGVSPAVLACATRHVLIPMPGAIESLNVGAAVAVCLFEQARQLGSR
ncbi:TrmH family RNA methyltransferase [Thauera humireducens]|uniref:rRNA methyltransferase n=1 Tax=Thauera humireducens TaxID=1134435 RepID=A0A127K316_9RHOO|nr:RNA methyltransferase [Thauera humireducens]AMO36349.1 rRNA methyltransferase [Thauera humireducens]